MKVNKIETLKPGIVMPIQDEIKSVKKAILVVDDEINLLHSIAFTLKRNGYKVTTTTNGKDAFDIIVKHEREKKSFDLIITDMQLPGLTGKELIKELDCVKIDTPVLVITAHGTGDLKKEICCCSYCDFLSKPFDTNELVKRVSKILNGTSK